jgi:putative FmdB family regulatory protein
VPTYQYACNACGHQLEIVQSFSDAALTECPACKGQLRKLFSAVGIVFKGSGFYRTDSRSGTATSETAAAAKAETAASTSNSTGDSSSGSSDAATSSTSSTAGASKAAAPAAS